MLARRLISLVALSCLLGFLPACLALDSSVIGRSAQNVAQESGNKYTLGSQFEDQLAEMIHSEVAALGVKEDVPLELNRQVLLNIDYFLNDARSFMTKGLSRGSKYIPMMKAIFRQKGLPEDLVYMALIESGFKTDAVSHASAVGPWQFISATGRHFGLTINEWLDERRDPVKSTYAAADYLTSLHDIFNSWPLAIAAYNSGEGKILRGMKSYGATNFWDMSEVSGHLAAETKLYVPSFLAATFIAKDPAAYGLEIEMLPPDQWEEVVVPEPITLKEAATYAGQDFSRLKELNPQLRKEAIPPKETDFVLRLPVGSSKKFAEGYEKAGKKGQVTAQSIAPGLVQTVMESPLETSTQTAPVADQNTPRLVSFSHKVQSGDTLESIAKLYGVSQETITTSNQLGSRIKPGQVLTIPSNLPLTAQGETPARPLMVVETKAAPKAANTHVVAAGENLGVIAQKYNMSVRELADINNIKGVTIQVGQKLKVYDPRGKSAVGAPSTRATVHVVKSGESLGLIAQKYGLSVKELMALNGLKDTNIKIGQKLKVAKEAARPRSSVPAQATVHVVKSGESLGLIAQKYGFSVKDLMALNGLKDTNIKIGQKLKVTKGAARPQSSVPAQATVHVVKSGESLGLIAQKYGFSVKDLMALNGLKDTNIKIGQKLKVTKGAARPQSSVPAQATVHVVKSGESLGLIAQKYGISVKDLMALNGLKDTNIKIGQKLKVAKGAAAAGKSTYKVVAGDTLYSIASKHKLTVAALRQLNNLTDKSILRPGQTLKLQ